MSFIHWRSKATERIEILDLICEVWNVTMQDVTALAEGRSETGELDAPTLRGNAQADAWNKAWRVMYDLDNHRKAESGVHI